MTKHDLKQIGIIAAITIIIVTLPGMLYLRGLPITWTLALVSGYLAVALLGYASRY